MATDGNVSDEFERAEDWPCKEHDGWLAGIPAVLIVAAILLLNDQARHHYPWYLTAWVMALIYIGLHRIILELAYAYRRGKK